MRPLVSSSIILAAVVLTGATLARWSDPAPGGHNERASSEPSVEMAASPSFSPTFLSPMGERTVFRGGTIPEGLELGAPPSPQVAQTEYKPYEFFFTRGIYGGGGSLADYGRRRRGSSWATDWPKADRQFMVMVDHLIHIDASPDDNAISFADPQVRRYPWIYALEVGRMSLTAAEVQGMRDYLHAGGFLVIDDFWGSYEWSNFRYWIDQVLPGRPIVELPLDHPIFHAFYNVDEILQVPNVSNGRSVMAGYSDRTWENDGYVPMVLGMFDEDDRLMVVINFNTDLGDAWEWAEDPWYPLEFSRFAAEMGINMIVYGMSH